MNGTLYTAADDAQISAGWPDVSALAGSLGRTTHAVRAQARLLGLPCATGRPKRPFTADEIAAVRERYPAEGAIPLAEAFGRQRADIVSLAQRLGVNCELIRRWTSDEDARVADLIRGGASHQQVADAVGRTVSAINKRVVLLGLAGTQPNRQRRREKALVLLRPDRGGAVSRWAKERIGLGEHGWPPDLTVKEVKILDTLQARGPLTRRNLSLAIGEAAALIKKHTLRTHNGQSVMTRIQARGLVTKLSIQHQRQRTTIFTLTAAATQSRGTYESVESFNAEAARPGPARSTK